MKKSLSLILFLALFLPSSLYALTQGDAQLYFDQTSKNILVDENFSISLLVNSGEQAVNAFEATINIPDYLEIVSASYDSSICQLFISRKLLITKLTLSVVFLTDMKDRVDVWLT